MIPLYNGQENHYKKMLDLQEKLRQSEEERIRLEERFNLMAQESRNRHQACINRLRMCYVEFLEEQKSRDERNSKLRGTLDKIDSSLAMMSAKTERLNILRKQYEAYLLRAYGNQRTNGSVTADSGLESQNDQDNSPSPILLKSIQMNPKTSYSYVNEESVLSNYKTPVNPENENAQKMNLLQKPVEVQRNLNVKFSETNISPNPLEDSNDILKNRSNIQSYLDNSWKYPNTFRLDVPKDDGSLKVASKVLPDLTASREEDLDRYIGKIKRLHTNLLQSGEHELEHSFEEADHDQNTSGDLLNASLSEDGQLPSMSEEVNKVRSKLRGFRGLTRSNPVQNDTSILSEGQIPAHNSWANVYQKFVKPDVKARLLRSSKAKEKMEWPLKDIDLETDTLEEARRLVQENRALLAMKNPEVMEPEELHNLSEVNDKYGHESKGDDDGGIEDDYDESVDIESWMPDDIEKQIQEVHVQDNIRERLRRKLESIEEVEQTEDEEIKENEKIDTEKAHDSRLYVPNETSEQNVEKTEKIPQDLLDETNSRVVENPNESINNNEKHTKDEQDYSQNNNGQQQFQENSEYFHEYAQQQNQNQKQYQYSDNLNQQYEYDVNARYSGYENQQYADYMNKQYQYDPNQPHDPNVQYEHDPNQMYQQYDSTGEYENYINNQNQDQGANNEKAEQNNYDQNAGYDYSQQPRTQGEEKSVKPKETHKKLNTSDLSEEQEPDTDQEKPTLSKTKTKGQTKGQKKEIATNVKGSKIKSLKENKKKKDVVKAILDSDSESFIERNLSNTESDYDFN